MKRRCTFLVFLLSAVARGASSDNRLTNTASPIEKGSTGLVFRRFDALFGGRIQPDDIAASGYSWVRYETSADLPNFFTGSEGTHTAVATGETVARDNAAVGFYRCCFAPQYEQVWTWNVYAPDASGNPTVLFRSASNHQTTDNFGNPCWDGFFCGATSVDFLPFWNVDCTWKLGNYKSEAVYQFRSLQTDPLSTAAVIFQRTWKLGPSSNAVAISVDKNPIHPAVSDQDTGYTSLQRVAAATTTVRVRTADCNAAIGNVAFILRVETDDGGSGHVHIGSAGGRCGTTTADPGVPIDDVAMLAGGSTNPAGGVMISGTTDSSGNWSTTLTTGTVAGNLKLTAGTTGAFLGGPPATSRLYTLKVGFIGLQEKVLTPAETTYLYLTGQKDPHPFNHYGSPELNDYIRILGAKYYVNWPLGQRGQLGINDMSLVFGGLFDVCGRWVVPHQRHRGGTDVDFSHAYLIPGIAPPPQVDGTVLKRVCREAGGFRVREGIPSNLHCQIDQATGTAVFTRLSQ